MASNYSAYQRLSQCDGKPPVFTEVDREMAQTYRNKLVRLGRRSKMLVKNGS